MQIPHAATPCKEDAAWIPESKRRWAATVEWRRSYGIDTILDDPPPKFYAIKKCYPHFLCGVAKTGNYVYWEQPGLADFKTLMEVSQPFRVD